MSAVARVTAAYAAIDAAGRPEVWITLRPAAEALADAAAIDAAVAAGEQLPLAGLVAAVKDNIDVAGLPTTAGAPSYAYLPARDATCVARLRAAGAVVLGKTNLDQFATGLVGTRSPYGAVRNAWDAEADLRRIQLRVGGRGGARPRRSRPRHGHGRLRTRPRRSQRHRRPQAHAGRHPVYRRRAGLPVARLRDRVRAIGAAGQPGGRGDGGPRRRGPACDPARQRAARRLAAAR